MKPDLPPLPIHSILPELKEACAHHNTIILAAEPGSGKTTIVPLVLLEEPWLHGQKIIVLEPRRLAVRMAARRMSDLQHDTIGNLVGYRIRFDKKISPHTKIEVVTEGILTRMIQNDPELTGIGMVIFDEFHERTLMADLGLALCHDVQELRGDLKIMIMSATMDNNRASRILANAPVITGEGRCYPVTTHYLPRPSTDYLVPRTIKAIHRALAEEDGDILVFLPGAGDIKRVQSQIQKDCFCLPLYGNLPQREQDHIFQPTTKRRVILATPIAETSLTIEGVTVVIDSGQMKTPRFSSGTGLTSLCSVAISKASAKQRAGRAGRLSPGVCYRLWTTGEHHSKADFTPPEICNADLAPLLLETLQWGVSDPRELTWIDPPRESQIQQAKELLEQLGIITQNNQLTKIGRKIAPLPLHPRLALMIFQANKQGHGNLACSLAALLQNRDLFREGKHNRSVDIEDRLEILRLFTQNKSTLIQARGADPSLCRKVTQEASQYKRLLHITDSTSDFTTAGDILALAYPDRIAMQKKETSQHILSSGRGVLLDPSDHLHHAEFLVVASLDGGKKQGRIYLAAAINRDTILTNHSHLLKQENKIFWDKNRVSTVTNTMLGKLEFTRKPLAKPDPKQVHRCLLEGIQQTGIHCLKWQKKSRALQARIQSAHVWNPKQWPDVSDDGLLSNLDWLEPYLGSSTTLQQLAKLNVHEILLSRLSYQKQQQLDKLVPSHIRVASGSNVKLTYQPGTSPILAVRLQEMFGTTTSPTVFAGQIPILIHLLSPASRPIQITNDLAGFWQNTYHQVKKELKGRYPKHYWPDDPLTARATARIKPKKKSL